MFNKKNISAILILTLCVCNTILAQAHYEILVGASGGKLTVHFEGAIALEYDGLSGWFISDHLCWISDESIVGGVYETAPAWAIELEGITLSSGLYALSEDFQQILNPDNFLLGLPVWEEGEGWHFHNHTIFGAGGGNVGDTFTATLRLVDTGGVYQASDAFMLDFATVPEPMSMLLLGCGAFMLKRHKR